MRFDDPATEALYRSEGMCEHLAPVLRLLEAKGELPYSIGRPWTSNCRIWACYDALLDCDRLIQELHLDPCVQIHDHRGTHDGSERGLVCSIHHDAVIGRHPSDAR